MFYIFIIIKLKLIYFVSNGKNMKLKFIQMEQYRPIFKTFWDPNRQK